MSDAEIDAYYATERPELLRFLGPHGSFGRVLDIGCASGVLGMQLLRAGLAGTCDGIELHEAAARLAGTRLRRVWQGSLESVAGKVSWQDYDLIVMADVLEHLVDPWAALRRLPKRQRAVVVLRYFDDLSEQETARLLGVTVGTVKSQASRALAALRVDAELADGRTADVTTMGEVG